VCAALLCTAAADARPVKISHKSAALEFTYAWPAEAAAIPALDRKFRAEAAARYRQSLSLAREDQKVYQQQKRGSIADFYSKEWTTAGESRRLLSLQSQHSAYTGGAHPNTDYGALLWDRERSREVTEGLEGQPARVQRLSEIRRPGDRAGGHQPQRPNGQDRLRCVTL
jgi:Deacetylase PdaC